MTDKAKPRYYHKDGKLFDAGIEISEGEAMATLKRNEARRKKNAETVAKAPETKAFSDLANRKFDEEDKEISAAILERSLRTKK